MRKRFTKVLAAVALLMFLMPFTGWGQTKTETTTTYVFTSKSWTATVGGSAANWTSVQDGAGFSNNGIQVTTAASGANGTSPVSFTDVTKIVATYNTNKSKGAGTIEAKIGSNDSVSKNWAYSTGDGTSANYTVQWDYETPQTGNVKITCLTTTNSIYLVSVAITTTSGGGDTPTTYTVTYDGNGSDQGTVPTDNNEYGEGDEVTVLGPGTMAKTGHTFEWWEDAEGTPYEEDDTFEIYENTTLTAQWTVNTYDYNLSVTGDDGEAEAELEVDGSTVAQGDKIAYNKEVTVVVATNDGYRYSIAVEDADHNAVSVENDKFTMPASDVTVTVTTTLIPTYTINFNAGTGTAVSSMSGLEGSSITLPTTTPSQACVSRGWTFAGWATASVNETTTAPALLNEQYTITGNATLYAVYKVTEGDGGTTTFNFETIASANNWTDGSQHTTVEISPVTISANGGGNNGKYYVSDKTWRMYNGGSVSISATGNNITSVSSDPSTTFTISNGSATQSFSATTKFKSIEVTYGSSTTTYNSNPECLEKVATPTFTVTGTAIEGEENTYNGAISVAINCTTEDATIQYKLTENGEWQNYSQALSVSQSTTIWAKATKNGMDDSEVVSATYTILQQYTLTVTLAVNVTAIYVFNAANQNNPLNAEGEAGNVQVLEGTSIMVSPDVAEGYVLQSLMVGNTDVTSLMSGGAYTFTMTGDVTITATAVFNPLVTATFSGSDMAGMENAGTGYNTLKYITVNNFYWETNGYQDKNNNNVVYGMIQLRTRTNGSGASYIKLPDFPGKIETIVFSVTDASSNATTEGATTCSSKLYFQESPTSDGTIIAQGGGSATNSITISLTDKFYSTGYILANGGARIWNIDVTYKPYQDMTGSTLPATIDDDVTVSIPADANVTAEELTILASSGIVINSGAMLTVSGTLTNNGNANNIIIEDGGQLIFKTPLGKAGSVKATLKKEIDGFGGDNTVQTGWYTIASPLTANFTPTSDMLTETYDLYYFDEAGMKWKNYRKETFEIIPEKGYLYANTADKTISFAGDVLASDAEVENTLSYTVSGFNLMGNPFTCNITKDSDATLAGESFESYYIANGTIDGNGKNLLAFDLNDREIKPCEGFIVQATNTGQTLAFNKSGAKRGGTTAKSSFIRIEAGNKGFMDRAYIHFGNANTLRKLSISDETPQVYVMQDGKDYAAATIQEAQGEMPVNFRAYETGEYTITVNPEEVEMGYLHLIDNIAGQDIDLLATPSYTFNARTDDYESRFRLVFSSNMANAEMGEDFAFFSNGQLVIANEGEAILQVIDVTGRVVATESINGTCSKAVNAKAGVYVLRLINGTDVKTQKMVIR